MRGNARIINWRRKSESYYLLTRFGLGRLFWCHETVLMHWLRLEIPFKFVFSLYKSDNWPTAPNVDVSYLPMCLPSKSL